MMEKVPCVSSNVEYGKVCVKEAMYVLHNPRPIHASAAAKQLKKQSKTEISKLA